MKRLFYFTGYRLSVLHWKGKQLIGSSSFEPTQQGLDQFRNYLLQTENIPGKFLVDVIEADFRNEKLGHKIREAQLQKIPYMLILGDRECEKEGLTPRLRNGQNLPLMTAGEFLDLVAEESRHRR